MITVRTELSEEDRDLHLRSNHLPGERVRVDKTVRYRNESASDTRARHASFGDGELAIEEFIVDADGSLKYRFAGVEGEHDVRAFRDAERSRHCYGVLLAVDDELWLVPLAGDRGDDRPALGGTPAQVDPTLDRLALYWVGPYGPSELLEAVREEPWAGEFHHSDPDTGPCRLKGSPWHSRTSEAELRLAREAVEDHVDALSLSARSLH